MENIRVSELFAGVGGFRLALEGSEDWNMPKAGEFKTVWANQWEPGTIKRQFAWECYEKRFGEGTCVNQDITEVLDEVDSDERELPVCDMLVGGFPCQDYSVAKALGQADGIQGKKGVLWWQIVRFLDLQKEKKKEPIKILLLENVDRLLKSPVSQRGRDFAVMLACLNNHGYSVEWRVVNAAEYGFPQKRRRVYVYATLTDEEWDLEDRLKTSGVLAEALPIEEETDRGADVAIEEDLAHISENFGINEETNEPEKVSVWQNAGVMQKGKAYTTRVTASLDEKRTPLKTVLVDMEDVPEEFFVDESELSKWEKLKDKKSIKRKASSGFEYLYSEGSMAYPDSLDKPARTILTAEGGRTPSRFKHIIKMDDGRWRRLVPDELDAIQGFPKGWTDTGMSYGRRAFCMGNALVVGVPHRIGGVIWRRYAN